VILVSIESVSIGTRATTMRRGSLFRSRCPSSGTKPFHGSIATISGLDGSDGVSWILTQPGDLASLPRRIEVRPLSSVGDSVDWPGKSLRIEPWTGASSRISTIFRTSWSKCSRPAVDVASTRGASAPMRSVRCLPILRISTRTKAGVGKNPYQADTRSSLTFGQYPRG